MNSLEHRLHIGLSLSLLLLFSLLWFLGQRSMNELIYDFVQSRMEHDVESLLSSLDVNNNSARLKFDHLPLVYQQPYSGHYFMVSVNHKPVIHSRSLWDQMLKIPRLETGAQKVEITQGPRDQELLQISMAFNKNNTLVTIALAEDLTVINQRKQEFKTWFFIMSLGGLVILLLIQSVIIRLSFKRLESVCSDVQCLEEGEIVKLSENVPTEVLPLVQEVNHLLSLLEKRLERSRNALGNLSHALKSPLNLLYQYLNNDPQNLQAQLPEAQKQVERINQLINRELKRARLAGKGGSSRRFNPTEELPELINVIKQMYRHKTLDITYHIAENINNFGDREDMLELIGNLLDNAGKWSAGKIHIDISSSGSDRVLIRIEDNGPGIAGDQIKQISQRGARLDESVDGHGLGLSIVNDIVKLYAGSISMTQSPMGGLRIDIYLDQT